MAKVSLVVPVYQAEQWIDECMASIHAQTYKDVELIVEPDPQGSGAAAARNRGLERATGEYVMFCDADDYLAQDAVERMVIAIDGVDMACGAFRKFGAFDSVVRHGDSVLDMPGLARYVIGNLRSPMTNQMLSGCWAKIYRRSKISPFPLLTTAEDMAFNFDYLRRCKTVRFVDNIVYHNRKRSGSLSTTFNEADKPGLFGYLEALEYVRDFLIPYGWNGEIDRAIDSSKTYHAMLYFMRICEQKQKPMREVLKELYA